MMMSSGALTAVVLVVGSAPLVHQDLRDLSVWQPGAFLVVALFAAAAWWTSGSWASAAALSAGVLTAGAAFLLVFPESLGEADVLYLAALAWLLPFWSLLFAVGLSCVLGLAAFLWLSRQRPEATGSPLPFLPCLALGGLGAWGGSL